MLGFGRPSDPPPPPPDPEGTIRIGGIRVTVEQPAADSAHITLHDKRIGHYKLFSVIEAHLRERGFNLTSVLNLTNSAKTTNHGFSDFPSTVTLYVTADNTPPLTAETITAECKSLSERISDSTALNLAFAEVEKHKRNKAIAERFKQQGGHSQRGS